MGLVDDEPDDLGVAIHDDELPDVHLYPSNDLPVVMLRDQHYVVAVREDICKANPDLLWRGGIAELSTERGDGFGILYPRASDSECLCTSAI